MLTNIFAPAANNRNITAPKCGKAYQRANGKKQRHVVMTALIAALYWLATEKGFGETRLSKYVCNVMKCIEITNERDLDKLCDDLKYDTKIDLKAMCRSCTVKTDYAGSILCDMAYGLTAVLWPLYEYYGWRQKRMTTAAREILDIVCDAADNGIEVYTQEIERRTRVRIDLDNAAQMV